MEGGDAVLHVFLSSAAQPALIQDWDITRPLHPRSGTREQRQHLEQQPRQQQPGQQLQGEHQPGEHQLGQQQPGQQLKKAGGGAAANKILLWPLGIPGAGP